MLVEIREYLKDHILIFDGAMGTMLQKEGLPIGDNPEIFGIKNPHKLLKIHINSVKEYEKKLNINII